MPPKFSPNSPSQSQEEIWVFPITEEILDIPPIWWPSYPGFLAFGYRVRWFLPCVYFRAFVYVYIRVNSCFFLRAYVYVYFGVNSWVFFEALVFAYVILLSKYVTMSVYWTRHLLSKWNIFASRSLRQPSFERLRCWLHLLRPPLVMLNFVIFSTVL